MFLYLGHIKLRTGIFGVDDDENLGSRTIRIGVIDRPSRKELNVDCVSGFRGIFSSRHLQTKKYQIDRISQTQYPLHIFILLRKGDN